MQLGQILVFESIEDIVKRLLLQDVVSDHSAVSIDPVLEHIQYIKTLLRMSYCCSNQRARVDLPPLHSFSQPCGRSFRRLLRSTPSNSGVCDGPRSDLSSRACTVGCTEARRVSQALRRFCCRRAGVCQGQTSRSGRMVTYSRLLIACEPRMDCFCSVRLLFPAVATFDGLQLSHSVDHNVLGERLQSAHTLHWCCGTGID